MRLLPALLLLLLPAPGLAGETAIPTVAVVGTAFRVTLADGRTLADEELLGAVLEAADEAGNPLTVRIDGFRQDPLDPTGQTVLYALSTPSPDGAGWTGLCRPGPDGLALGFPLAGAWAATGEHLAVPGSFALTCTGGAVGKCVRLGYRPWTVGPDGRSLRDLHQACVRAIRADYCGDGRAHTKDGTVVDLYDRLGIQKDEPAPGMRFEAAWGPDGALCVARPRRPELTPPETLEGLCPARLAGRTGPAACGEGAAGSLPGVLLLTKS